VVLRIIGRRMTPSFGTAALTQALGLAVALGCGLLIGIERERRKGRGPDRAAAGLRSFAVAALAGGMAQWSGEPALVGAGALLVAALAVIAYAHSRRRESTLAADPGITTELALFATYLVGVLSVQAPALGAACGVGLAGLLAARERLHHFATDWLNERELHDGLLLAALALIVLPLVPSGPIAWLGGITPRPLAFLIVLILALQAVAHIGLRLLGARLGIAVAGFVSGFVSSTATVAAMGRQARNQPELMAASAAAAGLSGSATWVLALLIAAALAPALALVFAPAALAGAAWPVLLWAWWLRRGHLGAAGPASADLHGPQARSRSDGSLQLREAVMLAALLVGIAAAVAALARWLGPTAVYPAAALAALADAHAAVAALASLAAREPPTLTAVEAVPGMLLAVGANTGMRLVVAALSGGRSYAWRVAVALVGSLLAALALWLGMRFVVPG
jgi:uncharacterized membrane protein (DUF4010 family)